MNLCLDSHHAPLPDLRDAHTPVRQSAHRDPIQPRSSVQAGAESVAASLVRADTLNVKVLADFQLMNAVCNLAVLARLLYTWTEVCVPQSDAVSIPT